MGEKNKLTKKKTELYNLREYFIYAYFPFNQFLMLFFSKEDYCCVTNHILLYCEKKALLAIQ